MYSSSYVQKFPQPSDACISMVRAVCMYDMYGAPREFGLDILVKVVVKYVMNVSNTSRRY